MVLRTITSTVGEGMLLLLDLEQGAFKGVLKSLLSPQLQLWHMVSWEYVSDSGGGVVNGEEKCPRCRGTQ